MPDITDFDVSQKFTGVVKRSDRITPDDQDEVRQISLEINHRNWVYEDARNIGVFARGPKEFGSPILFRLYSIAGVTGLENDKKTRLEICVKRCFYIDEVNGEKYPGVVSNHLCDLKPGDTVNLAGPFGVAFRVPEDNTANLIMIGQGTGIAPFRPFIAKLYQDFGEWNGKVLLFHGARTGMELLYMNDEKKDLAYYYDKKTFEAIKVISARPHFDEPAPLDSALEQKKQELWQLLQAPNTYVYVAGLRKTQDQINSAFVNIAGSIEKWSLCKADLVADKRWDEILY